MKVTIVQLKEYLKHCKNQEVFFNEQLELKAHPEQRETHLNNSKYYKKEIVRIHSKIDQYPF